MMKGSGVFEELIWDQQLCVCAHFPPAALSLFTAESLFRPGAATNPFHDAAPDEFSPQENTNLCRQKCLRSPAPSEHCCMSADNS